MRPIEEQGYLIPAWCVGEVDYVAHARTLAESIKQHVPGARVCVLTNQQIEPDSTFDHVQVVQHIDTQNPWANDWLVWSRTPFRETIKLEADMVICSPIAHWWTLFRNRDVYVSTGCRNWRGEISQSRFYRRVIDENHLPDVYNAITYWRRSELAREFFDLVRNIFQHWDQFRQLLRFPETVPSTDTVYAMAAQILGPEQVTIPAVTWPQIVHMKQHHAGTTTESWQNELIVERLHNCVRINTVSQWGALHHRRGL